MTITSMPSSLSLARTCVFCILHFMSRLQLSQAAQECEVLKSSLSYTQEEAPRDLSGLVSYILNFV
jgi:hypothetical protein